MLFLRISVAALTQLLLFLFIAGSHDLLGGWNQTDAALGTLLVLFLFNPIITLVLLVVEIIHYKKTYLKQGHRRGLLFIFLAFVLFLEALAIDLYLLTQVRMH